MTSQEIVAYFNQALERSKTDKAYAPTVPLWEIAIQLAIQNDISKKLDEAILSDPPKMPYGLAERFEAERDAAGKRDPKEPDSTLRGEKLQELYGAARNLLAAPYAPKASLSNYNNAWTRLEKAVKAVGMLPARLPKDFDTDPDPVGEHGLRVGWYWVYYESTWILAAWDGEDWNIVNGAVVPKSSVIVGPSVPNPPKVVPAVDDSRGDDPTAAALRSCAKIIQDNRFDSIKAVDYLLKYAEAIEWHEARKPSHHPHMKDEMDSEPEPKTVQGQTICGQCQQDITGTDHRGKCPAQPAWTAGGSIQGTE